VRALSRCLRFGEKQEEIGRRGGWERKRGRWVDNMKVQGCREVGWLAGLGFPFASHSAHGKTGILARKKRAERGRDAAMIYADDFALSITRVHPSMRCWEAAFEKQLQRRAMRGCHCIPTAGASKLSRYISALPFQCLQRQGGLMDCHPRIAPGTLAQSPLLCAGYYSHSHDFISSPPELSHACKRFARAASAAPST
jgi:hypothetical protein